MNLVQNGLVADTDFFYQLICACNCMLDSVADNDNGAQRGV